LNKDELILKFDIKAVSFQQQRFSGGGVYKTAYQKEFEIDVRKALLMAKSELDLFASSFNEKTHVIESHWLFGYEDFFTVKEGKVSSKCLDLDNSIKNIQDYVFKFMQLDDKYICETHSFKWKTPEDCIFLRLKLWNKEEMNKKVGVFILDSFTN